MVQINKMVNPLLIKENYSFHIDHSWEGYTFSFRKYGDIIYINNHKYSGKQIRSYCLRNSLYTLTDNISDVLKITIIAVSSDYTWSRDRKYNITIENDVSKFDINIEVRDDLINGHGSSDEGEFEEYVSFDISGYWDYRGCDRAPLITCNNCRLDCRYTHATHLTKTNYVNISRCRLKDLTTRHIYQMKLASIVDSIKIKYVGKKLYSETNNEKLITLLDQKIKKLETELSLLRGTQLPSELISNIVSFI